MQVWMQYQLPFVLLKSQIMLKITILKSQIIVKSQFISSVLCYFSHLQLAWGFFLLTCAQREGFPDSDIFTRLENEERRLLPKSKSENNTERDGLGNFQCYSLKKEDKLTKRVPTFNFQSNTERDSCIKIRKVRRKSYNV